MIIDFKEQTEQGVVEFTGELTNEEVSFLLRYALLSLLSKGMLPPSLSVNYPDDDDEEDEAFKVPDKKDMN